MYLADAPTLPHGYKHNVERAKAAHDVWEQTLRSVNFVRNRSGFVVWKGRVANVPLACCGVPAMWVAQGYAPPLPDAEFEGRAFPMPCDCAI